MLFTDDPTWQPTSRETWDAELGHIEEDLGLSGTRVPTQIMSSCRDSFPTSSREFLGEAQPQAPTSLICAC